MLVGDARAAQHSDAATQAPDYVLEIASDLGSVSVQARFPVAIGRLRARAAGADDLLSLRDCEDRELGYRMLAGGRLELARPTRCLRYRALLRSVERGGARGDRALLTNIRQWFWLPERLADRTVQVVLRLPDDVQASVPWLRRQGRYEFGPSPHSGDALALFGGFPELAVPVANGTLRVAVAATQVTAAELQIWQQWLQRAAHGVAQVAGKFPNPDVQLLVVPGSRTSVGSPVPFGHVIRDMGEAVRFFVEPNRSLQAFLDDWTASHEFAHLLLPYVDDKWVSEGFASYYQNILMARRGSYTAQQMWQRLSGSFAKADAVTEPPTLMGLQDAQFWRVRMLVYWSGAAVALLADARLRELSAGAETLDTVLARVADCCLPHARTLSGVQFFELLDSKTAHPVFVGLFDQFAHSSGQPPVAALFAQMGVVRDGTDSNAEVVLREDAPLAWVRRGIEGSANEVPAKPASD
ncbi:MAG: hypothetical protein AB8B93_00200 [Pseudomonadales bacterium]